MRRSRRASTAGRGAIIISYMPDYKLNTRSTRKKLMAATEKPVFVYLVALAFLSLVFANPCDKLPGKTRPWCDLSKSHAERVEDLIADLTLAEKGLMISSFSHVRTILHVASRYRGWFALVRFGGGIEGVGEESDDKKKNGANIVFSKIFLVVSTVI